MRKRPGNENLLAGGIWRLPEAPKAPESGDRHVSATPHLSQSPFSSTWSLPICVISVICLPRLCPWCRSPQGRRRVDCFEFSVLSVGSRRDRSVFRNVNPRLCARIAARIGAEADGEIRKIHRPASSGCSTLCVPPRGQVRMQCRAVCARRACMWPVSMGGLLRE